MRAKKWLSLILAMAMILSLAIVPAAAEEAPSTQAVPISAAAQQFSDVPEGHWAEGVVERWTAMGLLNGYTDGTFRPDNSITRGELFSVLDRLMQYQTKADNVYGDLGADAWYTDAILGATAAGVVQGSGGAVRPNDNITRQEAMVLVARVLRLTGEAGATAGFTDADQIASWAEDGVKSMAGAGYVQGSNGAIRPTDHISRAEVVTMLDNVFPTIYAEAGTYTEDAAGNVLVNVPGVTLKDMNVKGDLIVAEGVGTGDLTLDSVKLDGRMVVRGGGENSIRIIGSSTVGKIVVSRVDGKVRVSVEDAAKVEIVVVDDGSDAVKVEGSVNTVEVTGADVSVEVTGTVKTLNVAESAEGASVTVADTAKVENVTAAAPKTELTVAGTVTKVETTASAADSSTTIAEGAKVTTVAADAPNASVAINANVKNVEAGKNAAGASVAVAEGVTVDNVKTDAAITVDNQGTVKKTEVNADGVKLDGNAPDKTVVDKSVTEKPTTSAGEEVETSTKPSGGGSYVPPVTSITVDSKEKLDAALLNSQYSTITIDGTIGNADAPENYVSINVARAVTLNGGTVYGAINLLADGITLNNITINSRGGGDDPMKNAVNVVAKSATITGCAITAGSEGNKISNAIVIYPTVPDATYTITGNTISSYQQSDGTWGSSGIAVTEGYDYNDRFGMTGAAKSAVLADDWAGDRVIALGNTFENCSSEYVRINWTNGGNGNYRFGYYGGGYSSQFASSTGSATMLLGGTVGISKDVTYPSNVTIEILSGANVTIAAEKTVVLGGTMTIASGATLTVNGTLTNNGTINGTGSILMTADKKSELSAAIELLRTEHYNKHASTEKNVEMPTKGYVEAGAYYGSDPTTVTIGGTAYGTDNVTMSIGKNAMMVFKPWKVENSKLYIASPVLLAETMPQAAVEIAAGVCQYTVTCCDDVSSSNFTVAAMTNSNSATSKIEVTESNDGYQVESWLTNYHVTTGITITLNGQALTGKTSGLSDYICVRKQSATSFGLTGSETYCTYDVYPAGYKNEDVTSETAKDDTRIYEIAIPGYGLIKVTFVTHYMTNLPTE